MSYFPRHFEVAQIIGQGIEHTGKLHAAGGEERSVDFVVEAHVELAEEIDSGKLSFGVDALRPVDHQAQFSAVGTYS